MGKRKRGGKKAGKSVWLLEYILVLPLFLLIRMLPFTAAMNLGAAFARLVYLLDKRHREITNRNLKECLTGYSDDELARIAVSVYENLGYGAVEFILSHKYDKSSLDRHFSFTNYESFVKANAKGRGVLLLTAHVGSWELMALAQSLKGHPFGVVVRPLDNPFLDNMLRKLRTRFGNTIINKTRGMRQILNILDEGGGVGVLLDQNVTRNEGVFVDFFGRQACTNKGLALIAMKTGAPVVPAFIHRIGFDRHEIILGDELPLVSTGDKDADLQANTQAYTKTIEDFIRQYPDQWFWMHKRWNTRPKVNPDA